jgi:hypothetical protein
MTTRTRVSAGYYTLRTSGRCIDIIRHGDGWRVSPPRARGAGPCVQSFPKWEEFRILATAEARGREFLENKK